MQGKIFQASPGDTRSDDPTELIRNALPFLDLIPEGVMVLDRERRVVAFNQAMEEITGYAREEVLEHKSSEFLECQTPAGNPHAPGLCPDEGWSGGDKSYNRLMGIKRKDGRACWVQIKYRGLRCPAGECQYLVGLVRDVTGELELAKHELSARTMLGLEGLAGELAEEIRNPLNSIDIQIQLLGRMVQNPSGGRTEAFDPIRTAREEIRKLNKLVVETFQRDRMARRERRAFRAEELLLQVGGLLADRAESRGVHIEVEVGDDVPALYLDPDRLLRALLCVATNGIEAMDDGGILRLIAHRDGDGVALVVADTGPGVPQEAEDKIFQMFYTTKEGGTGIGLPLAKTIVEELGGSLRLAPSEQGAEFVFRLPLR